MSHVKHVMTWLAEALTVGTAGWTVFAGSISQKKGQILKKYSI